MFHDHKENFLEQEEFAELGTNAVAYMRKISTEEIVRNFPNVPELQAGKDYWALFAANGEPLMLSDQESELKSSAFYNDLQAILPN
ncbi:MAG: DUF1150 family protein [Pseudomonadota bacterium]